VVLWSVVFLAFLMTQILTSSRTAITLAANLRAGAQARAADDGAIDEAIFHALAAGGGAWPADSAPHVVSIGGIGVTVRIESLAGLVNPNLASAPLLTGLLIAAGEKAGDATRLAGNVADWRSPPPSPQAGAALLDAYRAAGMRYGPPGAPFADLAQLADVLGFTPALLARLAPYMSVYQPGDPDPAVAPPVVRQAIAFASTVGPMGAGYESVVSVRITACASAPAAAGVCRTAIVRLLRLGTAAPYQVELVEDGQ